MSKLRKIMAVLLSACMVFSLSVCAAAEDAEVHPGEGATKIGIILGGNKEDYGFNYGFYKMAEQMEEELGVEAVIKENVPGNSNVEGIIEELISQGCGIIIPTQFGYLEFSKNVAERHPDVAFYSIPLTDYNGGNFSTMHGTIQDIWYLEGILAGLYTESNNIGFIGSLPIPDVIVAINAFTLGVQSVNEEAQVNLVFTGSWDDTGLQTTSCNQLINDGADVIAPFQDSIKTIIEICASNGVHAFGCNSDAKELDPETWLSACENTADGWIPYIKDAIDGKYETANVIGSFDVGLENLASYGDSVSQEIIDQVEAAKQQITDGELYVFEGPVTAQDGTVKFEDGYRPSFEEINNIDWLVEGVNGSLS